MLKEIDESDTFFSVELNVQTSLDSIISFPFVNLIFRILFVLWPLMDLLFKFHHPYYYL